MRSYQCVYTTYNTSFPHKWRAYNTNLPVIFKKQSKCASTDPRSLQAAKNPPVAQIRGSKNGQIYLTSLMAAIGNSMFLFIAYLIVVEKFNIFIKSYVMPLSSMTTEYRINFIYISFCLAAVSLDGTSLAARPVSTGVFRIVFASQALQRRFWCFWDDSWRRGKERALGDSKKSGGMDQTHFVRC